VAVAVAVAAAVAGLGEELEVEQGAVALAGVAAAQVVGPVLEVEQGPEQVVAAGQELVRVRLQGQASARAREPRSVLGLMHP
jgi:hypothetical protein